MKTNKQIKVCHVAYSDTLGGAARAAYRIHQSLKRESNDKIISTMRVIKKISDDNSVFEELPISGKVKLNLQRYLNKIPRYIHSLQYPEEKVYSIGWPSTSLGKYLNVEYKKKKFDLLNLHYLADNTLSIREIGKLKMPIVWRLNDQWPFCSCEHYSNKRDFKNKIDLNDEYINDFGNKLNLTSKSLDIKRIVWEHKKYYWNRKINIIAPTNWIANCAKKSYLFKNQPINIIPSAIDLKFWKPIPKDLARKKIKIETGRKVILFGALGGTEDYRKGGDILISALEIIKGKISKEFLSKIKIIIFGQENSKKLAIRDFDITFVGRINNDEILRNYYSASDVFVLPSRIDNLPGTGIEAHSCGTPIVAFDVGGLSEIIENNVTGYLVKPFNKESFAEKILSIIETKNRNTQMGIAARRKALILWDEKIISKKYCELYSEILHRKKQ